MEQKAPLFFLPYFSCPRISAKIDTLDSVKMHSDNNYINYVSTDFIYIEVFFALRIRKLLRDKVRNISNIEKTFTRIEDSNSLIKPEYIRKFPIYLIDECLQVFYV